MTRKTEGRRKSPQSKEITLNGEKLKYNGKMYYLYDNIIYDNDMNVIIENATNGFLDLYEYYEYFPQNKEG